MSVPSWDLDASTLALLSRAPVPWFQVLSLLEALPRQLTADTLEELRLCKQALVRRPVQGRLPVQNLYPAHFTNAVSLKYYG